MRVSAALNNMAEAPIENRNACAAVRAERDDTNEPHEALRHLVERRRSTRSVRRLPIRRDPAQMRNTWCEAR